MAMANLVERKRSRLYLGTLFRILVAIGLIVVLYNASSFFFSADSDLSPVIMPDQSALFPAAAPNSPQTPQRFPDTSPQPPSNALPKDYADNNPILHPTEPDAKKVSQKKPVAKKPPPKKPAAKNPEVEKPIVKEPDVEKPIPKEPVVKKPIAKEPDVKKPIAKEPDNQKPIAKEPDVKKPIAKKPNVKKPVAKKPDAKKLNGEDAFDEAKHATTDPTKAIVVSSTTNEKTAWLHQYFSDWELKIYIVNDPTAELTVEKNQGRESAVYLSYMIDYYDKLPDIIVFSHAQRYQWHTDDPMYDSVGPLKLLQLPYVQEEGYVPLRCVWYPSCPVSVRPNLTKDQGFFGTTKTYAKASQLLFPDEEIPKEVGAPCCSTFAVTREEIHKRPVDDYKRYRNYLWSTGISDGKTGRVFEFLWHRIFHRPIKSCKAPSECYCKTFGLCYLKCPDPTHCVGRYIPPPINKPFPKGWPHPEQKVRGFPEQNWWEQFYPPDKWDGWEPRNKTQHALDRAAEEAKKAEKAANAEKAKQRQKAKQLAKQKAKQKPKPGVKAKLKPVLDSVLNWKPRPDRVEIQGG